jgi:putative tryptophan/tyrosine transport system substrate-binding protein
MTIYIRRREFVATLGSAVTWPLAARAQSAHMRRVGVLMPYPETAAEGQARVAAFTEQLRQLGWIDGRNLQVDLRWATNDAQRIRRDATELVALTPDAIVATANQAVAALQQATRSIPIVFVQTADPVGAGFVESLARPGGNITGFTPFEFGTSAKWLELLKEIAPNVTRAAVLRDATNPGAIGQMAAIQSVAPSLGVEVSPIGGRDAGELERAVAGVVRYANVGVVVTATPWTVVHGDLIVALAARHRLPAVYPFRSFITSGGLISYGPDTIDQFRRAAGYVDRILKGEKPADLPVQAPTRYELIINLKTAKASGFELPATVLARADEVIE